MGKTLNIIKENPIFGVGADCLIYTQLENTSDMFNVATALTGRITTIYILLQQGIPSLLCYIALLLLVLKKAFTGAKEFMSKQTEWIKTGLLFAVLAYIIISLFGISINTVAPFFWIILGILYSQSKTPSPDVKK